MIKVLFFIHDLGQGGAEKVLVNLVNNLDTEKFDITLMSLFGGGVNEQFLKKEINYKYIYNKTFPGNSHILKILNPEQLHRMYIKEQYDIEIAFLEGPVARIISGCPNSRTRLIYWIHCTVHSTKEFARGFRTYKEAKICMEKFHKGVFVSQEVMNAFGKYCNVADGTVLYNTNESDEINTKANEKVETHLFSDTEIKLIGVGKIETVKGFDRLARIHKRFISEGFSVHTYILGDGSKRKELQEYLERENIGNTFTLLGYQTNPYKYISKCNLYVCSSYSEGFSTAATEALIIGIPVITTAVSGMTELLGENGEWGTITENDEEALYQGIKYYLENPDRIKNYTVKAQKRGKDFSKENTVLAVQSFLQKAVYGNK